MADEGEGVMNLDLNLGPVSPVTGGAPIGPGSSLVDPINLEDWVEQSLHRRFREALRQRRWRSRDRSHARMPFESQDISVSLMVDSSAGEAIGGTMQTGEGSNAVEMSSDGITKICENMVGQPESEIVEKEDVDKGSNGDGSSFFDCNICLDLSKEPVVTSCGHLFCWACLYRWLHIHSDAKECPVCKGEVTVKNVTPIFGRGNGTREVEEDPSVKIPDRPPARRVESLRQAIQRTAFSIPMEEMIRRLGSRFDLTRDFFHQQEEGGAQRSSTLERTSSLLNRILTSRGIRREQISVLTSEDLGPDTEPRGPEFVEQRRLPQLFYRRSHAQRAPPPPPPPPPPMALAGSGSGTSSAERFFDSFVRNPNPGLGRSQEQIPSSMEDRDSISSIMAMIHGESQTMDTAVEIESTVSLSTSSSRRRHDASRMSDVDSGDSRMPRRRRLN